MSKATDTAQSIMDLATKWSWNVTVRGSILTITKQFTPGSSEEFANCDMEYGSILGQLPRTKSGSDWGTDGGGIGAISAIQSGRFVMNRSGGSVRVLNQLKKMIG